MQNGQGNGGEGRKKHKKSKKHKKHRRRSPESPRSPSPDQSHVIDYRLTPPESPEPLSADSDPERDRPTERKLSHAKQQLMTLAARPKDAPRERRPKRKPKPKPAGHVPILVANRSTVLISAPVNTHVEMGPQNFVEAFPLAQGDRTKAGLGRLTRLHRRWLDYILWSASRPDAEEEIYRLRLERGGELKAADVRQTQQTSASSSRVAHVRVPPHVFDLLEEVELGVLVAELMTSLQAEVDLNYSGLPKSAGEQPLYWPQAHGLAMICGWQEVFCRAGGAATRFVAEAMRAEEDTPAYCLHAGGPKCEALGPERDLLAYIERGKKVLGLVRYAAMGRMRALCGAQPYTECETGPQQMENLFHAVRLVCLWTAAVHAAARCMSEAPNGRDDIDGYDERVARLAMQLHYTAYRLAIKLAKRCPEGVRLFWAPNMLDMGVFKTALNSVQNYDPLSSPESMGSATQVMEAVYQQHESGVRVSPSWTFRVLYEWMYWAGIYYRLKGDDTRSEAFFFYARNLCCMKVNADMQGPTEDRDWLALSWTSVAEAVADPEDLRVSNFFHDGCPVADDCATPFQPWDLHAVDA